MSARFNIPETGRGPAPARRGGLLLEVIVAMTIMVSAMALMGGQLAAGLRMTTEAELATRAIALADRLIALLELDLDLQGEILADEKREGDFGHQFPGWSWRLIIDPYENLDGRFDEFRDLQDQEEEVALYQVTIEIYHQPGVSVYDEFTDIDEDTNLVRSIHLLKTSPPTIDLVRDFGVDEEQLAQITEIIPDFDVENVNPQALVAMLPEDPEALIDMLPMILPLIQMFGGEMMQSGGSGPSMEMIEELLRSGDLSGLTGAQGDAGALEELMNLRDGLEGGGAGDVGGIGGVGGGPRGPVGGGRAGFGARAGDVNAAAPERGSGGGGQPRYTIEDLMRLRDQGAGGR